jgi:diaminopimelate epimerase
MNPEDQPLGFSPERIRKICHRNYGIGSDGILWGPLPSPTAVFGLRIFNPDGSEAEKSGNGLRIFCRYLWDQDLVGEQPFNLETKGGLVRCQVLKEGKQIRVEMGRISFWSSDIPISGERRQVLQEPITIGDRTFIFSGATIGNPHCIIPVEDLTPELAKQYGPLLENHSLFPNRTNVQFLKILDRNNIRIEIWERGAGYTLASGSSSSAAAAVAKKLGHCDSPITVHMPGGKLLIETDDDFNVTMTGSVTRIAEGHFSEEIFESTERQV